MATGLQGVKNLTNKETLKKVSLSSCSSPTRRADQNMHISLEHVLPREKLLLVDRNREGDREGGREGDGVRANDCGGAKREEACIWHSGVGGCDKCVRDPLTGFNGLFCAKAGYCEYCSFCQVEQLVLYSSEIYHTISLSGSMLLQQGCFGSWEFGPCLT